MAHILVEQLRFARNELRRCMEGVSAEDAVRRLEPSNSLSWIVGHLANQEQYFWVILAQGKQAVPGLNDVVGYGKPASTPPLDEMWDAWQTVTAAADRYLDTLTPERMQVYLPLGDRLHPECVGTMLLRNIMHYWYHIGEAQAIRQQLGHTDLPEFVGDLPPYCPE